MSRSAFRSMMVPWRGSLPAAAAILFVSLAVLLPTEAFALTKQEVLARLGEEVLRPSSDDTAVVTRLRARPMARGIVEPVSGGAPRIDIARISGHAQWFAFVDLFPCEMFSHEVLYVFVDDVTGYVTTHAADDWPKIDGVPLGLTASGEERLVEIYPLLPRPRPLDPERSTAPIADYGDAPDFAPGSGLGRFPTRFDTVNSPYPGAHAVNIGLEGLGRAVSSERGAQSADDGDRRPNLIDADGDERMFIALDRTRTVPDAFLIFDVSVSPRARDVARYVNAVFDFDGSLHWGGHDHGAEWALVNHVVRVAPGSRRTLVSPAFPWGSPAPHRLWCRVVLSRAPIQASLFGAAGWDGSGRFDYGEVEDFDVRIQNCMPAVGEDDDDDDPPPPPPPPPPPEVGWNGEPVKKFALVVQGPDHPGQSIVAQAAAQMEATLAAQGYATERQANTSGIRIAEWFFRTRNQVVCQDKLVMYFVAHGRSNTPGGLIRLGSVRRPESYRGSTLSDLLGALPHCADERCDVAEKSCDVTVIMESCYSGQWHDLLRSTGRRIITTAGPDETAKSGADGTGAEYSDRFGQAAEAAADPSSGVDANQDGAATFSEIHAAAAGNVRTRQTPRLSDDTCECNCPEVADCVFDPGTYGEVTFSPSHWALDGEFVGYTFEDGVPRTPEVPVYDESVLVYEPNEWEWNVEFALLGQRVRFYVSVVNFTPAERIAVEVLASELLLEGPVELRIDVGRDRYEILLLGTPLHTGPWSGFGETLPPAFRRTGLLRQNFVATPGCCDAPYNLGFSAEPISSEVAFDAALAGNGCAGGGRIRRSVAPGGRAPVYVNAISNAEEGIQGLSLAIEGTGDLAIEGVSVEGTSAERYLDGGFVNLEVVDPGRNAGRHGVVAALIFCLTCERSVTLRPEGTESVLRVDVGLPRGDLPSASGRLSFADGLVGSGMPVENVFTVSGEDYRPCNVEVAAVEVELELRDPLVPRFVRGDADSSGIIGVSDAVPVVNWLIFGGHEPLCLDAADADASDALNLADPILILNWLFLGGPPPRDPSPSGPEYAAHDCGPDDGETLGCETQAGKCRQ